MKGTALECRTIGVDMSVLTIRPLVSESSSSTEPMTALVFDTAGHNEFYNAHLPFISPVGVYLIVYSLCWSSSKIVRYVTLWSSSLPRDDGGRCVVGVIGTRRSGVALLDGEKMAMDVAKRAFVTAVSGSDLSKGAIFGAVDSLRGVGIAALVDNMWRWWCQHSAGFTAPKRWVRTIDCIMAATKYSSASEEGVGRWLAPVLTFTETQELLAGVGFVSDGDLRQALAFLDSIGLIVYKGRAGSGRSVSSRLDDIVLLRPQVVTDGADALQRLITPTVKALTEIQSTLQSTASWCERCGSKPPVVVFWRRLLQCGICSRWFCEAHISSFSVDGTTVLLCEVCKPLSTTRVCVDIKQTIDVSVLAKTGRLSRTLLASLWGVYPSKLQSALEALLIEAKFLCRAPESWKFVDRSRLRDDGLLSAGADDLFVPCIFVQCPTIARRGVASAMTVTDSVRTWTIDVSLWPAGMWSDVIGCLASVNARWEPERCGDEASDVGSAGEATGRGSAGRDDAVVRAFPECGTVIHLQSMTSEPLIGSEEVEVRLECERGSSGVVDSRIVVSGWYATEAGNREAGTMAGRTWRLLTDVLLCIHRQLSRHSVLSKYHSPQVSSPGLWVLAHIERRCGRRDWRCRCW